MTAPTAPTAPTAAPPATDRRAAMARSLDVDAGITGAVGVVLTAAAGALDGPLGIPAGWLVGLGVFMLVYAADLVLVRRLVVDAGRPSARRWVRAIAVGNAGWVAASVAAILLGAWDLTGLGIATVLAQAAVVEWFVLLQRRASRPT